jgi:hypothetical protein
MDFKSIVYRTPELRSGVELKNGKLRFFVLGPLVCGAAVGSDPGLFEGTGCSPMHSLLIKANPGRH